MNNPELRFGLIGYGLWGAHHAQAIAKTPGARLAAIAEYSPANGAAAKSAFPEVEVCEDYRQLLARGDIDVVDVVVPSHLHYEIGHAALSAGKHLLMEKPLVLCREHADSLIALARQRRKVLAVDHEMRISALWGKVKDLIDQGVVGTPQYVLVELARFPYRLGTDGWRYDIRRVGNWILEEPIHFFDLARWYLSAFGEPVSVFARGNSRQADHPELQDNFSTIVSFDGGAYAVITHTLAAFEHHMTCKVTGTKGAIWARWSGAEDRTPHPTFGLKYSAGDKVHEVSFPHITGEVVELQQLLAAMVRAVRDGVPPIADGNDGRWAVLLCLAAQQSVDSGQPVKIAELS